MMNRIHFTRALTMGAALALSGAVCQAQPTTTPPAETAPQVAQQSAEIKVLNVQSQLVAYWFDPAHNPMPPVIQTGLSNGDIYAGIVDGLPRQLGNANGPLDLKLPKGVETISAFDSPNVLKVKGSASGIEALRKLVAEIDVPIGQTDVQVQFFEMAPAVLDSLKLRFKWTLDGDDNGGDKNWGAIADASAVTTELLGELMSEDRHAELQNEMLKVPLMGAQANASYFRLISSPRITVVDGLTSSLMSSESRPVIFAPDKFAVDLKERDLWQEGLATIQSSFGIKVKCVSKDDLIAMDLHFYLDRESAQMSAVVRDGQKLAMLLPPRTSANGMVRMAIVTPKRIVRH